MNFKKIKYFTSATGQEFFLIRYYPSSTANRYIIYLSLRGRNFSPVTVSQAAHQPLRPQPSLFRRAAGLPVVAYS